MSFLLDIIPHAVMNETFARGILYCKCLNRGRVENNCCCHQILDACML